MAQYIGLVRGARGEVSRLGSKKSGMDATARGWRIGGQVFVFHDEEKNEDVVRFTLDGGSGGATSSMTLAEFVMDGHDYKVRYANKTLFASK